MLQYRGTVSDYVEHIFNYEKAQIIVIDLICSNSHLFMFDMFSKYVCSANKYIYIYIYVHVYINIY